jgi:hypothetical protein
MNRNLALWIGVLGGPLIWLCSFEARFALAPWACTFQNKWGLYGVAITALILCTCCAALSWREWKALGEHGPNSAAGASPRSNFMAIAGIVTSSGCGMIVIAQAIPEFVLGACQ